MSKEAVKVFFSYSHQDESLRNKLAIHLSSLKRQKLIDSWNDRRLEGGQEWDKTIKAELDVADIILLLVSADFIHSDYCYDIEVKRAMERHEAGEACVIPIILRRCNWQNANTPFSKLTAFPTDGQPIKEWSDADKAFYQVTKGVQEAAQIILEKRKRHRQALANCHRKVRKFLQDTETVNQEQRNLLLSSLLQDLEKLELKPHDKDVVCQKELSSFHEKKNNQKLYEQDFRSKLQTQYPVSELARTELENLRSKLRLSSKDVSSIESWVIEDEDLNHLNSERGIDYRRLRDLLKAGSWQEADQETATSMLEVAGLGTQESLSSEDVEQFSLTDLTTIDFLWQKYSGGQFGFSVQWRIWTKSRENNTSFKEQLGWQVIETIIHDRGVLWVKWQEEELKETWLNYDETNFSLSAPIGHLPYLPYWIGFSCWFQHWNWGTLEEV